MTAARFVWLPLAVGAVAATHGASPALLFGLVLALAPLAYVGRWESMRGAIALLSMVGLAAAAWHPSRVGLGPLAESAVGVVVAIAVICTARWGFGSPRHLPLLGALRVTWPWWMGASAFVGLVVGAWAVASRWAPRWFSSSLETSMTAAFAGVAVLLVGLSLVSIRLGLSRRVTP